MILTILLLPLAAALVAWPIRKAPWLVAPLSAAACFAVAFLAYTALPTQSVVVLGRSLELTPRIVAHLALLSILVGIMLLYTSRMPQGEMACSFVLVSLTFFAASLMARSPTISALLLAAGAIAATVLATGSSRETATISSRVLMLIVIASMLLLVAAQSAESQGEQSLPLLADVAVLVLAFSLAIFLAQFPFFIWLPPVFGRAGPLAATTLSVLLSTTVLLRFGNIQMWSSPFAQLLLSNILIIVGTLSCIVACLAALAQRQAGRILAYAAIADLGLVLLGMGIRRPGGAEAALWHLAYRNVAVVTVSMAVGVLRECFGIDDREHLYGAIKRAPLAIVGLTIGGLSLAGLPPFAGFASRLTLYRLIAADFPLWALILALVSLGPAWAFARTTIAAVGSAPLPGSRHEPLAPGILILLLSLFLILIGLVPQLLTIGGGQWLDLLMQSNAAPGI